MEQTSRCKRCSHNFTFHRYHAGFSDLGYLYCDTDSTVLTWSSYDDAYESLVGKKHPWTLDIGEMELVERSIRACHCGGHFTFDASSRCPSCGAEQTDLPYMETNLGFRSIYYGVLGARIDGENEPIWTITSK